MKMKRLLSVAMALLLMASLPVTAFAQEYDIANGDITVSAEADGNQYVTQKNGVTNELQTSDTVIKHETNSTSTINTVTINAEAGATAEVTLDGVNIDVSQTGDARLGEDGKAALSAEGTGDVTIILENKNALISGHNRAGLEKINSGELTITDTDNNGSLDATGGNEGAGIGGGANGNGSDITIIGSEVTATGGIFAAGIGGGFYGHGSNITIEDSTVIANGGDSGPVFGGGGGAGIGGGYKGNGSNITIEGGKVTATGGILAAGIGGGGYGNGSGITITGDDVTATGGTNGAGIGGGALGDGSDITIEGGAVTATGGYCAAGIGGGLDGSGSDIKVWDDAQLKAQGGEGGGWTNIGAGAAVGNGGERGMAGSEVIPDTAELTKDGKIEYYALGTDMNSSTPTKTVTGTHEHKWNNGEVTKKPTCTETGVMTYTCTAGKGFTKTEEIPATGKHTWKNGVCSICGEPEPISASEDSDTQSAPLYRVTGKDDKDIGYKAEQKDGALTITVDADFAVLTGTLSGINTLKSRGVEKITFVTKDATSTFALTGLLEKGSLSDTYKLTHDGKSVTFTLGAKDTDVSEILEKA